MGARAIAFILLIVVAGLILAWPRLEEFYDAWANHMGLNNDDENDDNNYTE